MKILQQGGRLPLLTYTPNKLPIADIKNFIVPEIEIKRPVLDKSLFKSIDGLENDTAYLMQTVNDAYTELNTMTQDEINSVEGQKLVRSMTITPADISRVKRNSEANKIALQTAKEKKALSSYVRDQDGRLYVKYKGKLTKMTDIEVYKKGLLNERVEIQTASKLSNERGSNLLLVNNNNVISDIMETEGYSAIDKKVNSYLTHIGKTSAKEIRNSIEKSSKRELTNIWFDIKKTSNVTNNFAQVKNAINGVMANLSQAEKNALRNEAFNDIRKNNTLLDLEDVAVLDISKDSDIDLMIRLQMRNKIAESFKRTVESSVDLQHNESYSTINGKLLARAKALAGTKGKKEERSFLQAFISGIGDKTATTVRVGDTEMNVYGNVTGVSSLEPKKVYDYTIGIDLPIIAEGTDYSRATSTTGIPIDVTKVVIPKTAKVINLNVPTINGKANLAQFSVLNNYITDYNKATKDIADSPAGRTKKANALNTLLSKPKYKHLKDVTVGFEQSLMIDVLFDEDIYDGTEVDYEKFSTKVDDPNLFAGIKSSFEKRKINVPEVTNLGDEWGDDVYSAQILMPFNKNVSMVLEEKGTFGAGSTEQRNANVIPVNRTVDIRDMEALIKWFAPGTSSEYAEVTDRK